VRCLSGWLLEELLALRHANGRAMVRIYGPANTEARGGTVTLNLYDPQGHLLDYRRVEELAGAENISLRTGCFCNPGAGEIAEGLTEEDLRAGFAMRGEINLQSFIRLMQERGHKSAGAIRASIGLATNFADVWRFLRFIAGFRDQTRLTIGDVSFDIESCRIIRDGS
jgi:molybdenum cofactor sulfurtransferase